MPWMGFYLYTLGMVVLAFPLSAVCLLCLQDFRPSSCEKNVLNKKGLTTET